jgi:hypothetical protein
LSVIRHWILPLAVMGSVGFVLGALFSATDASVVARYATLIPFTIVGGAYIAHHVAREEDPEPIRRALRRARESRNNRS